MNSRTYDPDSSGLLVHGAWGLRPWNGQPLPLGQSDLPSVYQQMNDMEQDRVMDAALAALFNWAEAMGCTHVRAEVPLERDRQVLADAGLEDRGPGVVDGGFTGEIARALLLVGMPERAWVWRHDALVIYVHETWDSVVVTADAGAIEDLRGRIAEATTSRAGAPGDADG